LSQLLKFEHFTSKLESQPLNVNRNVHIVFKNLIAYLILTAHLSDFEE